MAKPKSRKADIEKLQRLTLHLDTMVDYRPLIAYVMKQCKATDREIGEVFGTSKQMGNYYVEQAENALKGVI